MAESPVRVLTAVPICDGHDSAITAIYVFAHEVSGEVTSLAVRDNLTPAETRRGVGAQAAAWRSPGGQRFCG